MSLRRFLNLVTLNHKNGVYSLRRMELSRLDLFYPTRPRKSDQKKLDLQEMESIRLPAASLRFHPNRSPAAAHHKWKVDCFGLSENKIIFTDNGGLSFLYDAGLRSVVPLPPLDNPKWCPISFSVANTEQESGGCSLYVMEKVPQSCPVSGQLEAFVYDLCGMSFQHRSWYRRSLPPPPYVLDPGYKNSPTMSYAMLGGGSHICISAAGRGTYCFDMATLEWSHAGDWMLPFYGKAEYVPELNLWFGLSIPDYDQDCLPCASDLSSALRGEKPVLIGGSPWRTLFPPEWEPLGTTQIVSLGSGRFCMLDFFNTVLEETDCAGNPIMDDAFSVFTGVELLPYGNGNGKGKHGNDNGYGGHSADSNDNGNGNGKRRLRMINHKSKIYRSDWHTCIKALV